MLKASNARTTKVANINIRHNVTNIMNASMESQLNVFALTVWYLTKQFVWRTNAISPSMLIVKIVPNCKHQKAQMRNAHAKMASSLTRIPASATFSTTVLMATLSKSPAQLVCTLMNTLAHACGQILPTARDAKQLKVKNLFNFDDLIASIDFIEFFFHQNWTPIRMNSDAQRKVSKYQTREDRSLPIQNTLIQPTARNSTFA